MEFSDYSRFNSKWLTGQNIIGVMDTELHCDYNVYNIIGKEFEWYSFYRFFEDNRFNGNNYCQLFK